MKFGFYDVLEGINDALPILAGAPALARLFEQVIATLPADDQPTLKDALAIARAENTEGHHRLQAMLAEAAKR